MIAQKGKAAPSLLQRRKYISYTHSAVFAEVRVTSPPMPMPQIELIFVAEKVEKVGPSGVKGLGEIGIVGNAAAIANAIFNITGKRILDFPITIDKFL